MSNTSWKWLTAISIAAVVLMGGMLWKGTSVSDLLLPKGKVIETANLTIQRLERQSSLVTTRAYVQAVIRKSDEQWYGKAEIIRIVPATISYAVDLSEIDRVRLEYDENSGILRMPLPDVKLYSIDPDMSKSETIRSIDLLRTEALTGNVLEDDTEKMVRPKLEEMGKSPEIIKFAREQAIISVKRLFESAFESAGIKVQVQPYFLDEKYLNPMI